MKDKLCSLLQFVRFQHMLVAYVQAAHIAFVQIKFSLQVYSNFRFKMCVNRYIHIILILASI